jgi:hypothetical protein
MDCGRIQELCQLGQQQLQEMQYLQAERTLAAAEQLAWDSRDWDSMARLYMPLQESRRQRRQRCGEGVYLNIFARQAVDKIEGQRVIELYPQGQLLIGGWGTIQPAVDARRHQAQRGVYVDVFLAAAYPADAGRIIAIVPTEDVALPPAESMPVDALIRRLPAHSLVMAEAELLEPTHAAVTALWQRLHAPFLAAADSTTDPIRKIESYRRTIRVDYACELAHQGISNTARQLSNTPRRIER